MNGMADFDISRLLASLYRRKYSIGCVWAVIFSLGVYTAAILPNVYQSSSLILVVPQRVPSSFVTSTITTDLGERMIIIDSPPVLATSDPMVLSRQVDGVMMVIRAGKTPKEYLSKALGALNSGKVLGIVLNGADYGLSSKYYYYYSSNGHDQP